MTLATQTPAQIDIAYVEILIRADTVQGHIDSAKGIVADYSSGGRYNKRGDSLNFWDQQRVTDAEASLPVLRAEYTKIMDEGKPHRAEYVRRGGWTRYAICKSDGGHVHRFEGGDPRVCSTLRKGWGTQPASIMAWLPEYSGLTPDQLIEKVGFTACTVCFPQAPVSAAWKRTEAAAKRATADTRLAKWEKGRELRARKVMNAEKRMAKHVAVPDYYGHTHADCLIPIRVQDFDRRTGHKVGEHMAVRECTEASDVRQAQQELARWDEKRPVSA